MKTIFVYFSVILSEATLALARSASEDLVCRGGYMAFAGILKQSGEMHYTIPVSFREHDRDYLILIRSAYPEPTRFVILSETTLALARSASEDLVYRGGYFTIARIIKQSCEMHYTIPVSFREYYGGYWIHIKSAYPVPTSS